MSAIIEKQNANKQVYKELAKSLKNDIPIDKVNIEETIKIHFIGIGGIGMSGIAKFLHQAGFEISGCDKTYNSICQDLEKLNIKIYSQCYKYESCDNSNNLSHIKNTDLIIYSAAISHDHPLLSFAKKINIPYISRAQALHHISEIKKTIAIAGTHGKTTTSSLITYLLETGEAYPSFIIGGLLKNLLTNSNLNSGEHLIIEACESDKSFLKLKPYISIITNIDHEHLNNYQDNINNLEDAFCEFAKNTHDSGFLIICIDNPIIKKLYENNNLDNKIKNKNNYNIITYSIYNPKADLFAKIIRHDNLHTIFKLYLNPNIPKFKKYFNLLKNIDLVVKLNGEHNLQNTLGSIAASMIANLNPSKIINSLAKFGGVKRRCEYLKNKVISCDGNFDSKYNLSIPLFDDYGHHPSEISATVKSLKQAYKDHKIILIFQPHRYSRTYDLYSEFVKALSLADILFILPIYSASEINKYNITSEQLVDDCKKYNSKSFILNINQEQINKSNKYLEKIILDAFRLNDIFSNNKPEKKHLILFQGAGNISLLANLF